jgi:hypothetical protein
MACYAGVACVRDVGRSFLLTVLLLCLLQAVETSARGVPLDVTTTKRPQEPALVRPAVQMVPSRAFDFD